MVLDVVVTGDNGKPVLGLDRRDFTITEDKVTQKIASFEPHDFNAEPAFPPQELTNLPPNTFLNLPSGTERGPLNVILFDLLNTTMDDQMFARKQLIKFVEKKPDGARFALFVLYDGAELLQGFTEDKQQLLAVASSKKTWPRVQMNYDTTLSGFLQVARFLAGLPGHKNLFWLSSSFPDGLFVSNFQPPGTDRIVANDAQDFSDEVKYVTDLLARSQIAVYPVDVRGVIPTDAGGVLRLQSSYTAEDEIADATGGHAYYSNNDVSEMLTTAFNNGSTYYTLSYVPSNTNYDGRVRKIHVSLDQPGYHLSYRRSYFGISPDDSGQQPKTKATKTETLIASGIEAASNPLNANMRHGAPGAHDLVFRAHIHPLGAAVQATPAQMARLAALAPYSPWQRKNQPIKPLPPILLLPIEVEYVVPRRQLRQDSADSAVANLQFAAAVFDKDGRLLNGTAQSIEHNEAPTTAAVHAPWDMYRVRQRIDVPAKATSIRISVRDVATDHFGTLEVPLPLAPETASK